MPVRIKKDEFRKVLDENEWNQGMLATYLKTSTGYVSQLINGHRNPPPKMRGRIFKLSCFKGCSFDDIFESVPRKFNSFSNLTDEEHQKFWDSLPESFKKKVFKFSKN